MKRKLLTTLLLASSFFVTSWAEDNQTVTINGRTIEMTVVSMSFNGDQVILSFSDQTSMTIDMSTLHITLPSGFPTDISQMEAYQLANSIENGVLRIKNLKAKMPISIFNAKGLEVVRAVAHEKETLIDMTRQPSGVYLLRAGNQIVKFVKR